MGAERHRTCTPWLGPSLATALTCAGVLAGCGASPPTHVVRVVDGTPVRGPYVSPYSYEWFTRGELLFAKEEYAEAARAYRQALGGTEEDPLVLARLGESLAYANADAAADDALDAALEHAPDSEAVWMARGRVALFRDQHLAAVAAFERAAQVAPRSVQGPLALARLFHGVGESTMAMQVLKRAAERMDETPAALATLELEIALTRRDAEALTDATERMLREGYVHGARLRKTARTLLDLGEPALAAQLWAAIPATADDAAARLQAFLAANDRDRAEGVLALFDVDDLGGVTDVARAYLHIGRAELAEHLLALQGSDEATHQLLLGRALAEQGKHDEAVEAFERVLAMQPDHAEAQERLAASRAQE